MYIKVEMETSKCNTNHNNQTEIFLTGFVGNAKRLTFTCSRFYDQCSNMWNNV